MKLSKFIAASVGAFGLVRSGCSQILSHRPSEGAGVSYSINVPQNTSLSGSGPIFLQLKAPPGTKWFALGQGSQMTDGNMFIVYSASMHNVTLSTRRATGHVEPLYDPSIQAHLLDGSGIHNGVMTANIRCDNCTTLIDGESALGNSSPWTWALTHGHPLMSSNLSEKLYQHDWHGSFSLNLTQAVGGNNSNPFIVPMRSLFESYAHQRQVSDTLLHKKRIAHGVMTSVAFVLLFPNFALLLYIVPSRRTVPWVHAPLQLFAVLLALAGFGVGISVSKDLQEIGGYHPVIGYVAVGGVVLIQPLLGIMQHLHFRKTGTSSLYGVSHRYLGRFFAALGVINGGIGFHYATAKNPDIPRASPLAYGIICGSMFVIYVSVILWRRSKSQAKPSKGYRLPFFGSRQDKPTIATLDNSSDNTLCATDEVQASREKPWLS
ncbi:cytochrome and DOMON domain-containing protein [Aspergillus ibericus CBS 121593]|uniref:Integral membrane protein n=1 Tax=Aspergillus ibericus CBS 121593 TaxID=1448316 RepID=A0A395H1V9_9EURO|nr:integral membrane protein [Aspergillus ibericus CBS 121593]RAL01590.1 integral membrane protein [Aspergillus ibericus CBS 121593]